MPTQALTGSSSSGSAAPTLLAISQITNQMNVTAGTAPFGAVDVRELAGPPACRRAGLTAMDVVELGAEVRDRALQRGRNGTAVALALGLAMVEERHHEAQLPLARRQLCHVGFTSKWTSHAASNPRRSGVVIRATYRDSGAAVPRRSTDAAHLDGDATAAIGSRHREAHASPGVAARQAESRPGSRAPCALGSPEPTQRTLNRSNRRARPSATQAIRN